MVQVMDIDLSSELDLRKGLIQQLAPVPSLQICSLSALLTPSLTPLERAFPYTMTLQLHTSLSLTQQFKDRIFKYS